MSEAKLGFEMRKIQLPLEALLPLRVVKSPHNLKRYQAIVASIREVGMIEPVAVYPQKDKPGIYLLLDGHLRCLALKQLGEKTADCIVANDDECFTYNSRISRLPPIQAHKMMVKAVRNGVRPERIAAALDIPVADVQAMMTLLEGINEEAADMLKDKNISARTIRLFKKVSGVRQIEMAVLMGNANNYAMGYAEALILGTPKDQLVNPEEPKKKAGLSVEDIARMENEMESLQRDFKAVEDTYAENMLTLTVARSYIKKLLKNAKVVRFISANHSDILSEFETITAAEAV
jgi:ParB-like chromosome segregation protein Spo0J